MKKLEQSYYCYQLAEFGEHFNFIKANGLIRELAADEVLIKVLAAGINPLDVKTALGLGAVAAHKKTHLPSTLGYDAVGEVVAVGDAVADFNAGDLVCGMIGFALEPRASASHLIASQNEIVKITQPVSDEIIHQLGGLSLVALTAMQALDLFELKQDETLYITGGNGVVATIAAQLGVLAGHKVVVVSRQPQRLTMLSEMGIEVIDYDTYKNREVTALFDTIGGDFAVTTLSNVVSGGQVVTLPSISAAQIAAECDANDIKCKHFLVAPNKQQLAYLVTLVLAQKLKLAISQVLPLNQIADAYKQWQSGNNVGKLILVP